MAEFICLFNKDTLIIKPPKKSFVFLRMIVLVVAMVCSFFICSICLKRINFHSKSKFVNFEIIASPLHDYAINQSRVPFLHYPNPRTFCRRDNISSIVKTLDRVYNMDWLTSASKNQCSAAMGFKWMLNQGLIENHKDIVEYFNSKGVSAIFLFRRNTLRRMVSMLANSYDHYAKLLNGTHKSHVHSPVEADALSRYKPTINLTSLMMDLKQMESRTMKAMEYFSSSRHIVLYYEDLIKNHTKLADVQEFLGLPQMNLTSRQVKIHKGPLWEHVKNWNDVNKTLAGTTYERFISVDY